MTQSNCRNDMHAFSALQRGRTLQTMSREPVDLFVIGGGITGVGIALDAVTRGLRTRERALGRGNPGDRPVQAGQDAPPTKGVHLARVPPGALPPAASRLLRHRRTAG